MRLLTAAVGGGEVAAVIVSHLLYAIVAVLRLVAVVPTIVVAVAVEVAQRALVVGAAELPAAAD